MRPKGLTTTAVLLFVLSAVFYSSSAFSAGFTRVWDGLDHVGYSSAAWGDYNNDGNLDLAVAGYDSAPPGGNFTSIYTGNGHGFMYLPIALRAVAYCSLAWGDYDNDGDLDLALAGAYWSGIYRNDNGTFVDTHASIIPVSRCSLAWGDYDNDGDLDLAIAGETSTNNVYVSCIYRNDDGTFTDIGAGLTGVRYCSLAWGDYDNDSDLDLALIGSYSANGSVYVSRIYRNDKGIFTDIGAGITAVDHGSLAWGDYDNDGDPDLAVCGSYLGSGSWHYITRIYRNDNGVFTDIEAVLTGVYNSSLIWGDFDNDGDLDIALAGSAIGGNTSRIYLNNGGSFTDSGLALNAVSDCSLACGDYDNDGDLDVAVTGRLSSGSCVTSLYRNDFAPAANTPPNSPTGLTASVSGNGAMFSWNAATDAQTPSSGLSYNLRVGTAPGKDDIFSGMANSSTGLRNVPATGNAQKKLSWILRNLRTGTYYWSVQAVDTAYAGSAWTAEQTLAVIAVKICGTAHDAAGAAIACANVTSNDGTVFTATNSSGYYEALVVSGWSGNIILTKGGYRFTPSTRAYPTLSSDQVGQDYTGYTFTAVGTAIPQLSDCSFAWGDYDNDGDLDFVICGYSNSYTYISKIYRNDNGVFTDTGIQLVGVRYGSVAWGDYDKDGDLDLALAGYAGSISTSASRIYRNDNGLFTDIGALLPGVNSSSLAWGDCDNDGDLDLAIAGYSTEGRICRIYRNDNGTFTDIEAGITGISNGSIAWGDYDNDGDMDLALGGYPVGLNVAKIYRNDSGTFTDINAMLTGVDRCSLAWGDYDNDGDLDLALSGSTVINGNIKGITKIYRNDSGVFVDIGETLTGLRSTSLAWGDYDNDGDLDLAIAGETDVYSVYASYIYRNNGGAFQDSGIALEGVGGSIAWGDYDSDGDLDLVMAGSTASSLYSGKVYRNDFATANTPPTAPAGLSASGGSGSMTFSWTAASDTQTPAAGLSYNIRVGTTPGSGNVFSGMANPSTGLRKVPAIGNAQKKLSWTLKNLPIGTLYWSVQAIDTAYAGSAWASEQQALVPDTTPPVITSVVVSPSMAAAGDVVGITVSATDNVLVSTVTADGVPLAFTAPSTWTGSRTAPPVPGTSTITVVATDASENTATSSASYKTAQVAGTSCGSANSSIMSYAKDTFLFKFWGSVQTIDTDSFWLSDGSGKIKIIAPGYAGIANDDYASARGILSPGNPPTLTCPTDKVKKLN